MSCLLIVKGAYGMHHYAYLVVKRYANVTPVSKMLRLSVIDVMSTYRMLGVFRSGFPPMPHTEHGFFMPTRIPLNLN